MPSTTRIMSAKTSPAFLIPSKAAGAPFFAAASVFFRMSPACFVRLSILIHRQLGARVRHFLT
jgi:hypothetical protein